MTELNTGDLIKFGKYDWRVLDVQNGKALFLSERVIEKRKYHGEFAGVTWETCDLRKFLNGEFLERFSAPERAKIAEAKVINSDNPWFKTPGGNDTLDRVFLLSLDELVRYFGDSGQLNSETPDDNDLINDRFNPLRIAVNAKDKPLHWWLRSPGSSNEYDESKLPPEERGRSYCAASVDTYGRIYVRGFSVNNGVINDADFEIYGSSRSDQKFDADSHSWFIRPAMWLTLENCTATVSNG